MGDNVCNSNSKKVSTRAEDLFREVMRERQSWADKGGPGYT